MGCAVDAADVKAKQRTRERTFRDTHYELVVAERDACRAALKQIQDPFIGGQCIGLSNLT